MTKLLTPHEAASLVGLTVRTIYKAIRLGELKAVRLGNRLRIKPADLEAWLDRNAV